MLNSVAASWAVSAQCLPSAVAATVIGAQCIVNCGSSSSAASTNVGAIVGGVVGGVALLALIGLLFYLRHKRIQAAINERTPLTKRGVDPYAPGSAPSSIRRVSVIKGGTGSFRNEKPVVAALFDNPLQTESTREIIKASRAANAPRSSI